MSNETGVSVIMFENQTRNSRKNILFHISMIIIFGGIISLPSIVYGFPDGGHDSLFHLTWFKQFSEQLWSGESYPRWLINENSGLGSPVFFYYGPVPYYISSILRPFFNYDPFGWQQLGMSAVIGLIASGFCAFLWIRSITNERVALLSAVLYMAMPYHVAIDLYERAAFPEFWSFVWMPLILYFLNNIKNGHQFAILGMAISYALLIMTHLPTTLIFSIIPIAYSFTSSEKKKKVVLTTLISMILGVLLSAIYLLPALSTQAYVNLDQPETWSLYMHNYLFIQLFPENIFRRELTFIVMGMIMFVSCAVFIHLSGSSVKPKKEFFFWVGTGIISVFMMTPISQPLVELFPVIHRIQFPWRFNTNLVLATTAITGISLYSLQRPYSRLVIVLLTVSAMLVISWLGIDIWQGIQESTRDVREILNNKILQGSFESYTRPRWVQGNLKEMATDVAQVNIPSDIGEAEIINWEPRDIVIKVNLPDSAMLSVGQLYYPGWRAHIIGQSCCLELQPSIPIGLINISVPGGEYEIALRLLTSTQEFVGRLISAGSFLIIIILAICYSISYVKTKQVFVAHRLTKTSTLTDFTNTSH
jgi:hypothetical protein